MKKQILSITLGLLMTAIATTTFAADKNHISSTKFTTTENLNINSSKDGLIVSSFIDGNEITSAYDKKGKLVYTITRYPADNVSKNIMNIVKTSYNNYFISGMEKVYQPGNETVFVVYIRNHDSFKTLRVVNNEVELVQNFQKG
jgi:hypothetical protein